MAAAVVATLVMMAGHRIHINLAGDLLALSHLPGLVARLNSAANAVSVLGVVFWFLWGARVAASFRHSTGDQRQRLKWRLGGAAVSVICACLLVAASTLVPSGGPNGIWGKVVGAVAAFGLAALPVAMGVGIFNYRLYDVNRLISRTLAYAIVTGLLIGVYLGVVTLATRVLPFTSPVGVAASTLVAVALFNPLRRRGQRLVDRRFNRAQFDVESTVSGLARRVRDRVDLEGVSTELIQAVQRSVEPSHVSLWLRRNE